MPEFFLTRNAEKDLRRIGPGPERKKLLAALVELSEGADNLDIKALQGSRPWLRLRHGNYRILYWLTPDGRYEIDRIIHRRDLHGAVEELPHVPSE